MKRGEVTKLAVGKALRLLRGVAGLTQKDLATKMGSQAPSQVSDWERGASFPKMESLVALLAACSEDGETVDFRRLQEALRATSVAVPLREPLLERILAQPMQEQTGEVFDELSRRLSQQEMSHDNAVEALRRRLEEQEQQIVELQERVERGGTRGTKAL